MPITNEHDYYRAIAALEGGALSPLAKDKLAANVAKYESGMSLSSVSAPGPALEIPDNGESLYESADRPYAVVPRNAPNTDRTPPSLRALREDSTLDAALDFFGIVPRSHTSKVSLADSMPNMIGGNVRHYEEPTRSSIEAEYRMTHPPEDVMTDAEYQELANARWAEIYDNAVNAGEPVVRISGMPEDGPVDMIGKYAARAMPGVVSAAASGLDAVIPGASAALMAVSGDSKEESMANLDDLRAAREAHPLSGVVGTIAGSMSPASVPGNIGREATKFALGKGNPLAQGLLNQMLSTGLAAGTAGVASALGNNFVEDNIDLSLGRDPTGMRIDPLSSLGVGMAAGAIGQGVGRGAGALMDGLRAGPMGNAIKQLEAAGGKLGFWKPQVPPAVQKNIDAAREARVHPMDIASTKIEPQLVDEAVGQTSKAAAAMLKDTGKAHHAMRNQTASTQPILQKFIEVAKRRRYAEDGSELPLTNLKPFEKELKKIAHVEVLPATSKGPAGAVMMSLDEANAMGLQVAPPGGALLGPDGMPFARAKYMVALRPKEITAPELDEVIDSADALAGLTSGSTPREPAWKEVAHAAREARDEFVLDGQPGGYSALKSAQSQSRTAMERRLEAAGLPRKPVPLEKMEHNQVQGLRSNLRGYASAEPGRLANDQALRELAANNPKLKSALEEMAATRATGEIQEAYSASPPIRPSITSSLVPRVLFPVTQSLRMRLDPILDATVNTTKSGNVGTSVVLSTQDLRRTKRAVRKRQ